MNGAAIVERQHLADLAPFISVGDVAREFVASGALSPSWDGALPHEWCRAVEERTGVWPPRVGIVWEYPAGSTWGRPFALTVEAVELLARVPDLAR